MRGNAAVQGGSPLKTDIGSALNADVTVTQTGVSGNSHVLVGVQWSYTAGVAGGNLKIKDGATLIKEIDIDAAGPGSLDFSTYPLLKGIPITIGKDLVVELADGGIAVAGRLNVDYR